MQSFACKQESESINHTQMILIFCVKNVAKAEIFTECIFACWRSEKCNKIRDQFYKSFTLVFYKSSYCLPNWKQ